MTQPPAEQDLDQLLAQQAAEFERDWKRWAEELEHRRDRRGRRTQRQFWFLFVFLFASFILLAYRTEQTASDLRTYIFAACVTRAERNASYNEGREVLIGLIVNDPKNPVPPEQR